MHFTCVLSDSYVFINEEYEQKSQFKKVKNDNKKTSLDCSRLLITYQLKAY